LLYLFSAGEKENLNSYLTYTQQIHFILMCWCYMQFFNEMPKLKTFGRTVLTYFVMLIGIAVIALISILIASIISKA